MKTQRKSFLITKPLFLSVLLLGAMQSIASGADTLNETDAAFIKNAAASGTAEVKVADLGTKKAVRSDVKAFAETVLADHTKVNAELKTLARAKSVELPSGTEDTHGSAHSNLEKLRGAEFDDGFLDHMVAGHKKGVSNFDEASKSATDSEVKAFAAKTLPALRSHLETAMKLSANTADTTGKAPDNTAKNMRDRDSSTLTPLDQGSSKSDTEITAQIRKDIIATKDMSVNAKNVKIITVNGVVTLRGPVNSAEEKTAIDEIARRLVGEKNVTSHLEAK